MKKGTVIILNGVSSSGKTSLAHVLQQEAQEVFYRISTDDFLEMLPDQCKTREHILDSTDVMLRSTRTISDMGRNVVMDVVIEGSLGILENFRRELQGYPVLWVHVVCPLHELRRREIQRGDREPGHSETQLPDVVPKDSYDLTVNTYENTLQSCAQTILNASHHPSSWTAASQI